jgi:hypothetical protein
MFFSSKSPFGERVYDLYILCGCVKSITTFIKMYGTCLAVEDALKGRGVVA